MGLGFRIVCLLGLRFACLWGWRAWVALVGVCIYIWLALGCPTPLGPHSSEDAYGFGWHVVLGRGGVGLGLRVACLWGWEAVGGIGRCMRFISTPHTHTHTHTHNLPSPWEQDRWCQCTCPLHTHTHTQPHTLPRCLWTRIGCEGGHQQIVVATKNTWHDVSGLGES